VPSLPRLTCIFPGAAKALRLGAAKCWMLASCPCRIVLTS
jgi:hypothetical protein